MSVAELTELGDLYDLFLNLVYSITRNVQFNQLSGTATEFSISSWFHQLD